MSSSSGAQPVSLTMTTAPENREARQMSAGSSMSQMSRNAEEEKVEQLKNMSTLVILIYSNTEKLNSFRLNTKL